MEGPHVQVHTYLEGPTQSGKARSLSGLDWESWASILGIVWVEEHAGFEGNS